jgi:hypothetical protein
MAEIEYADDDIRNIIFEDIDDTYAYGKYGDFDVIIMKDNKYINATKLCKKVNKEFTNWYRLDQAKNLIRTLGTISGTSDLNDPLVIQIKTEGTNETRGSYVHPKLIPHIASWCSPEFALKVSDIVNEYLIKEAIEEKERLLKKKDDKIDKLSKKIDKQSNEISTLLSEHKKQNKKINKLLDINDEMYEQNEEILGKISVISNDRVISTEDPDDNHMLIILKNNDEDDYDDSDEDSDDDTKVKYMYSALRVMKKTCKSTLERHKVIHPNMEILLRINYSPNSINLWKRIKNKLTQRRHPKIEVSGCRFNILDNYDEDSLINTIREIHNERLKYDD